MRQDKRIFLSVAWIIIGAILIGLAFAGKVDTFWNGVGTGLFCIGILQILRFRRFNRNAAYREKVEIEINDERNHFIRGKAWAWSGYLFVIICGVSTIIFRIMGQEMLSLAASYAVCLLICLYWISYFVLKRKY